MKKYKFLMLSMLPVLSGCESMGGGVHKTDSLFELKSDLLVTDSKKVNLEKVKLEIDDIDNSVSPLKEEKRNDLLNELVMISNEQCNKHKASIFFNQATWNITVGTISNILSLLGTVSNGEAIKSNLAAGAAFTGSSKNLVSQEIYMKQLSQTVIMALDNARSGYQAKIASGMSKPYSEYPVYEALTDLQEYHRRCSFYYGLVEISKALSNKKPTTKELDAKIDALDIELEKLNIDYINMSRQLADDPKKVDFLNNINTQREVIIQERTNLALERINSKDN